MGSEQRLGLAGALLFHGLVAVLFLFSKVKEPAEFIEVSWGESPVAGVASGAVISLPPSGPAVAAPSPSGPAVVAPSPSGSLALPERKFLQDQVPLAPKTKLDVAELPAAVRPAAVHALKKESLPDIGAKESPGMIGRGTTAAEYLRMGPGSGTRGGSAPAIGVAMEWTQGGTRRKLSGALPSYPPGLTVEAPITVEALVSPRGGVKSVRPSKKGSARLEEAAMREVRHWTFEPLASNAPQRDQTCRITFNVRPR